MDNPTEMAAASPDVDQWHASLSAQVRERFCHADSDPYIGPRVYFENAGGGLTLRRVVEVSSQWSSLPDNSARRHISSQRIDQALRDGRAAVATLLGATDGVIAARDSTTACMFAILEAIARDNRRPGANIVCSNLDHPSTYDAMLYIQQHYGIMRRVAPLDPDTAAVPAESILNQIDQSTIAVAVLHASNMTGARQDLLKLVPLIREKAPDAFVIIDGAQHVQHGLVDVAAYGVDAYVFSAYKVFSKPGTAFAYLSPRLATLSHPRLMGSKPEQWDLGTRDVSNYAAMVEVVDYLSWLGRQTDPQLNDGDTRAGVIAALHAIEQHEAALSQRLLFGNGDLPGLLADKRVRLHGERNAGPNREAVFAFSIDGVSSDRVVRELMEHRIIVHDRIRDAYSRHTLEALGVEAIVRISLAHYTSAEEIDRFLSVWPSVLEHCWKEHA